MFNDKMYLLNFTIEVIPIRTIVKIQIYQLNYTYNKTGNYWEKVEDIIGINKKPLDKAMVKGKNDESTNNCPQEIIHKLKIEQHESHKKPRMNSVVSAGYAVPTPLVEPVNDTSSDIEIELDTGIYT